MTAPSTPAASAMATSIALAPGATRPMPTPRPTAPKTITASPSSASRFTASRAAVARCSRLSPQEEQILVRVPAGAFGNELHLLEAARNQPLAHPRGRMERGAEVRPRHLRPADDELPAGKTPALLLVQPLEVPRAVGRQQQEASRPDDARELVHPVELDRLGKVREDAQRIGELEFAVAEPERRHELVRREPREGKVLATPFDRGAGQVAARHARAVEIRPVAEHAAAAAAEVENRRELLDF